MRIEEEKLDRFESDLVADVKAQKETMLLQAAQKSFEFFDKKETEILTIAYNTIQTGLKKIDKQKHEILSMAVMENKTKLLNKRMEVIQRVFDRVLERLNDFMKSEAYKVYLIQIIQENIKVIGDGDILIYLNHSDERFLEEFNRLFDNRVHLKPKNRDIIGGCKIFNQTKKAFLDDSFAKRIEDQRTLFLQNCKIQIEN